MVILVRRLTIRKAIKQDQSHLIFMILIRYEGRVYDIKISYYNSLLDANRRNRTPHGSRHPPYRLHPIHHLQHLSLHSRPPLLLSQILDHAQG